MADITMCTSTNCPEYNKCYRAQAMAGQYQSWANFEYTCNENSEFEDYIPIGRDK